MYYFYCYLCYIIFYCLYNLNRLLTPHWPPLRHHVGRVESARRCAEHVRQHVDLEGGGELKALLHHRLVEKPREEVEADQQADELRRVLRNAKVGEEDVHLLRCVKDVVVPPSVRPSGRKEGGGE